MIDKEINPLNNTDSLLQKEEPNFSDILNFVRRNLKLIVPIAGLSFLYSVIHSYQLPKKWEGNFQIVLSSSSESVSSAGGVANAMKMMSQAMGSQKGGGGMKLGGTGLDLETEIKILQSPSVLKPIFNFVKEQKSETDSQERMNRFDSWFKSNVSIRQVRGTSILDISYRDQDRDLIIPVLNKISQAYKQYSSRDREDSIKRGINYAETQVDLYKTKSKKLNKLVDNYEMTHGIKSTSKWSATGQSGERLLSSIDTGGTLSAVQKSNLIGRPQSASPLADLGWINRELIRRSKLFTDDDPSIKALKRERDALRKYVEISASGSIASPNNAPLDKETAQQIMIKYKEMSREAQRTDGALQDLENMLLNLRLNAARSSKPWELISNPTLGDYPIYPIKKQIVILGTFIGSVASILLAAFKDQKSNLIFRSRDLERMMPAKLLDRLPLRNHDEWDHSIKLIAQNISPKLKNANLAVLTLGTLDKFFVDKFVNKLRDISAVKDITLSNDLVEASKCDFQIIISSPCQVKIREVEKFSNQLSLQGKPVLGWILLDPYLDF